MKKTPSVLSRKEIERCKKNVRTNWRGLIKMKYLVDLYAFAPSQEYETVPLEGAEVFHAKKEGRHDVLMWWNAEKKQIECNRPGMMYWYLYCFYHDDIPI